MIVDRSHSLDVVEVQVELADDLVRSFGTFDAARDANPELDRKIGALLRHSLGINCRVTLMPPKGVPRSEGKMVRVVDRRKA